MNPESDPEQLLSDVALEGVNFREQMLGQTLSVVRRRRRWQQTRNATAVLLTFGVAAFLVYRQHGPHRQAPVVAQNVEESYSIVQTEPMAESAVVTTRPFANAVEALPTISMVQTTATSGQWRLINDDELLAIAPGPSILIRQDAHSELLVFADADDGQVSEPQ